MVVSTGTPNEGEAVLAYVKADEEENSRGGWFICMYIQGEFWTRTLKYGDEVKVDVEEWLPLPIGRRIRCQLNNI